MEELTIELEARVRKSVDYFMEGYGCCQSVVAAFADLYGMDENTALRIGAGFGGGVGRLTAVLLMAMTARAKHIATRWYKICWSNSSKKTVA